MRKKVIAVLLTASVLLCGCGGNETGISQEEYDKVVAERDAYKLELEQIKNSNQSTEQESKGETEEASGEGSEPETAEYRKIARTGRGKRIFNGKFYWRYMFFAFS